MNNPKLKVTYECHTCGYKQDDTVIEHSDAQVKRILHTKPTSAGVVETCNGDCYPVHLEVV